MIPRWVFRAKRFVELALSHPGLGNLLGRVLGERIRMRGCTIDTSGAVPGAAKAALFFGLYEKSEIRFVERYLRPDLDTVELGASLGVVSSHIARRLDPGHRLVSVEANPTYLQRARENVARNAPGVRAELVHGAVDYSAPGRSHVAFEVAQGNLASHLATGAGGRVVEVPRVTLADLLSRNEIGEYNLVCDVEGAEAGVLARDGAALGRCRRIIIELHQTRFDGREIGVEELRAAIERLGFTQRARSGLGGTGRVFAFERA